jgi:4-diphosphocytidyl-2-C-methyl-D-erythritol kinase
MKISVKCAAKINLYLDVIRRREDGFHDIETLFQPVSLWDTIAISTCRRGLELTGDDDAVAWNEENLCFRAASALLRRVGYRGGVRIDVHKEIPAGAGLGGGSSDAAGTLVGLNELLALGLSKEELMDIGSGVGSDVPFFIGGKPAVGRGRGELLEQVRGLQNGYVLIVKPDIFISSAWAYQNFKIVLTRGNNRNTLSMLLEGLKSFPEAKLKTYNSFEKHIVEAFPEIGAVLAALKSEGVAVSSLSGSGSACFAVFSEASRAEEASRQFISKGYFTRIARPVNAAILLLHEE